MGYVPLGKAVPLWESEAAKAGPVRRAATQIARSGSRRSFASTWEPEVNFARSGQVLQQASGQYGNYLLYKNQFDYQKEHIARIEAHEKDQEMNRIVGIANASMVGGPPAAGDVHSRRRLGDPNPSPSGGAPRDSFGTVTPINPVQGPVSPAMSTGIKRPSGSPRTTGMKNAGNILEPGVEHIVGGGDAPQQLQMDFSMRTGRQPTLMPGNTTINQETQARDARIAARRPGGMNPQKRDWSNQPDAPTGLIG